MEDAVIIVLTPGTYSSLAVGLLSLFTAWLYVRRTDRHEKRLNDHATRLGDLEHSVFADDGEEETLS